MKSAEGKSFQTFRKILSSPVKFFELYFEQSSIHGLAYFGKLSLTWIEKCLWITLVVTCFAICIILGLQSFDRYNTKSAVISLEKDHYYWNTSLPSSTICPMERLSKVKFDNYCSRSLDFIAIEGTKQEISFVNGYISGDDLLRGVQNSSDNRCGTVRGQYLCNSDTAKDNNISNETKPDLWNFLESLANSTYFNFDQINVSNKIMPLLDEIDPQNYIHLIYNLTDDLTRNNIEELRVRTKENLNLIHTQQVLTEFGICYMTNNFLTDHISSHFLIIGKHPGENEYDLKLKQEISSVRFGNMFDGEITYSFIGFDVPMFMFIHSPYEVTLVGGVIGYPYTKETISFHTSVIEIITTNDFQKNTKISQRNCRFIHESNLTHFPVYTRNLCMQECRIDFLYEKCNCIPHFYPNRIANPKRVCSYKQLLECLPKYRDKITGLRNMTNCYCLQNCEDSKIIIEKRQVMVGVTDLLGSLGLMLSVRKFPVVRFKRQILFTFTDFLVSIGGTAGFFLGFSVLGAVEVVYFFTFRYFWYLRGYK